MSEDMREQRRYRADAISDIFVMTSRARKAWERIDALVEEGWEKEYCKALVVLGHFRCGKTEMTKRYAADREERDAAIGRCFRWRRVSVPSDCTLKGFASAALHQLGDPDPDYGSQVEKTRRIVQAAMELKLDLLIIDEVQRLIDVDTQKVQKKTADWLAGLLDARCCPLLLVGERKASRVFESNAHLAGRTMGEVPIQPFDWADPSDRSEFRTVMHLVDKRLGMPNLCGLFSVDLSLRLHIYSGGRLGWVANLLDVARSVARRRGAPQLTHEMLAEACDMSLLQGRHGDPNPFRLSKKECEALIKEREGAV